MAGTINFNRDFAEFGNQVRAFEKADDVGIVVTEFMWFGERPFYPVGTLMESLISSVWLGENDPSSSEALDLIFRMPVDPTDPDNNYFYYEIVLRGDGDAYYGGYVDGTNLQVSDEIVNGHRVLETEMNGDTWRYVYVPAVDDGPGQYRFQEILNGLAATNNIRRRGKRIK